MSLEVTLPSLGDGIKSGDVLEIFVSEGEMVTKGQGLMEMETDKATVTVPSPSAGKVLKIVVTKGQSVPIGSSIVVLEATGAAAAPPAAPAAPAKPAQAPPQAVAPPSPPKPAPVAPPPPVAPVAPPPVATAPVVAATAAPAPATPAPAAPVVSTGGVIPAGPAVRRFAREVGVDLSQVAGSGDGGRITREDVLAVVRRTSQTARTGGAGATAVSAAPGAAPATGDNTLTDDYGPIRVEKMTKIRKTIANQMHRSWSTVPRVTNFDDADITELEAFRQSSKDDYAARGIKLTTMPFLIKAVATALRHHPAINAVIDPDNDQIVYKEYINVGIAVDTDRGLVVPTLKAADHMSIPDIAKALGDMSVRVRNGDFGVNDLRGGTFTISNLGAIGGTYSTPIVNIPEVAILLVGRARKLPVVMDDDTIVPRLMMPLSLSYDHRLVDGGTAARFLNEVIGYLEAPSRLLLAI